MIGVIMLDTRFPRIDGDIGNPRTFGGRVLYQRVPRATVGRVVRAEPPGPELSAAFVGAARRLERRGATVIGTSCGFLAPLQESLQAAVSCTVLSSSLLLLPMLRAAHRGRIGVLTFDAERLGPVQPGPAAGGVEVRGLPKQGELYRAISEDRATLDPGRAGNETMAAARALLAGAPDVHALVLECTNLSPYKGALKRELAIPVFDLVDALVWLDAAAAS